MEQTQTKADAAFLPDFWLGRHVGFISVPKLSLFREYYVRKLVEFQYQAETETKLLLVSAYPSIWATFTVRGCPQLLIRTAAYLLGRDEDWIKDNITLSDCVELLVTAMYLPESDRENTSTSKGRIRAEAHSPWSLGRMIDFFGTYYRWTVDDVMALSRDEVDVLIQIVTESQKEQKSRQNQGDTGHRPVTDARTKQDPQGVDSVMAFAHQHGVLKGNGQV